MSYLLNACLHLLHVASQERIGRAVDFTPVHRDLNLLQKLQDDQTVAQVPAEDIKDIETEQKNPHTQL